MSFLTGSGVELAETAAKAALMYVVAMVGLRLSGRRTVAQWSTIDFVAAVAVGATVGRTAVASTQSFAIGLVAIVVLLVLHGLLNLGRFARWFAVLVDHPVRLLVRDGQVLRRELRRCGLTDADLIAHLRQRGVLTLGDVKYVLYESKGGLTVVHKDELRGTDLLDTTAPPVANPTPP